MDILNPILIICENSLQLTAIWSREFFSNYKHDIIKTKIEHYECIRGKYKDNIVIVVALNLFQPEIMYKLICSLLRLIRPKFVIPFGMGINLDITKKDDIEIVRVISFLTKDDMLTSLDPLNIELPHAKCFYFGNMQFDNLEDAISSADEIDANSNDNTKRILDDTTYIIMKSCHKYSIKIYPSVRVIVDLESKSVNKEFTDLKHGASYLELLLHNLE